MNEFVTTISALSGPMPHFLLFFSFAILLSWWTKEWVAPMILMIIWSICAEYSQVYFPRGLNFSVTDIGWNLLGSLAGILLVQVIFVLSKMYLVTARKHKKEKENEINGDYA